MTKVFEPNGRNRPWSVPVAGILVAGALVLGGASCGDEKAGEGESCETSEDCKSGLLCRQKVCVGSGGTDGGMDADAGDAADGDATGEEPEPEDFYISYVLEKGQTGRGELRVFNTADGTDTAVSPASVNCNYNCWLSSDMKHFVYAKDNGGSLDIFVADVGDDLKAKGTGSTIVSGVGNISFHGTYVSYQKAGQSASNLAFYKPIEGGQARSVGAVEETGDWYVDPDNDVGVVYTPGDRRRSMEMSIGKAASRDSDTTYTFEGRNFQESGGSYFGGNVESQVSPDGELLALVTTNAPNDYDACTRSNKNDPWSSSACNTDKAFKCGEEGRCTRLENTVHIVDLSNKENLGTKCQFGARGACGPIHVCDAPSPKQSNKARCIPRRVVLGAPKTKQGPQRETTGCELIVKDPDIDFTQLRGPLTFDDEGRIYLVGARDRSCMESQFNADSNDVIPSTQVVRIDPKSGTYEKLGGMPSDKLFDAGRCYNDAATKHEIDEDCHIWVDRARVSPMGDEVAFTASNPNSGTPAKGDDILHLWHMLSDGSKKWFTGDEETSTDNTVTDYLRVHPPPSSN